MKRTLRLERALAPALLALLAACAAPATRVAEADAPAPLTVIALGDFHGALEPELRPTASGERVPVGGAALIAAYVDRIRATAPGPVVILDGGDLFQGTLASNLQEGAPVVRFYDALGVTAAALGNHEFDFGPVGPAPVPAREGDDPRGALRARMAEAGFPILAANVRDAGGQRPGWLQASVLVQAGGVPVGIVGAASPETPAVTARPNVRDLTFLDPAPAVEAEARALRARGARFVLVAYHGDPEALARALPVGLVDAVVGGHTHRVVARRAGPTALLQAGSRGRALVWAELPPDGKGPPGVHGPVEPCGAVVDAPAGPTCDAAVLERAGGPTRPAEFLGARVRPDPAVVDAMATALDAARAEAARPVGVVLPAPLPAAYDAESALGVLVADAFRVAVPGADVAAMNGGGLRAGLPAGPLSYGALFEALPFDNRLAVVTVRGALLRRIVELGHAREGGTLIFSGLTYEAEGCEVGEIRVGGRLLRSDAVYRLVTNEYLAAGGDDWKALAIPDAAVEIRWDLPWMRDVVADALRRDAAGLLAGVRAWERTPRRRVDGVCGERTP